MEKDFWRAIIANKCAVPDSYTPSQLLPELLENLGSLDAELRDDLSLFILASWLEGNKYSPMEMRAMVAPLKANLKHGLGESGTDSVFRRTFSAITLAELVHVDNKGAYLTREEVHEILDAGLEYLLAERDLRGYVPAKGWAHALAHTADLLMVLARSVHCEKNELQRILNAVSAQLVNSGQTHYTHDEDERLVNAIVAILNRDIVEAQTLADWVESLSQAKTEGWKDAYQDPSTNRARHNVKTFLRSLHYRLTKIETPPPNCDSLLVSLREGLKVITPWA